MRLQADWLSHPGTQGLCQALSQAGFQALFVGGCVRNGLMGLAVADIDISTDAHPERVMEIAKSAGMAAHPTGIDHGTVTVVAQDLAHEVTTFRKDVETDGRRAVVAFSTRIEDDARRRDFTMNALYADADGQVIDPLFTGVPDLEARRLRFIEDPYQRIREDYLRILRFFRFHAYYADPSEGFDADGLAACADLAEGVETLSRERIGAEMIKLLGAPDPAPAMAAMAQAGVLARVLPGADVTNLAVLVHLEGQLDETPDPARRLALIGGEEVKARLRLSTRLAGHVTKLRHGMREAEGARALGYRHGGSAAYDMILLRSAALGQPVAEGALALAQDGARQVFPVSAADLIAQGLEGPALGLRLKFLEEHWIETDFTLDRAALLALAPRS